MNKRDVTKKICQYGEDCYRKNPIHFKEYSHPHLEKILSNGIDKTTKLYKIPDELFMSKEIVSEQLQILQKLFPQIINDLEKKDAKTEKNIESKNLESNSINQNNQKDAAETVNKLKSKDNCKQEINLKTNVNNSSACSSASSNSKVRDDNQLSGNITKRRNQSPVPGPSNTNTDVKESQINKKQRITKNIRDYIPVVLPKGQAAKKLENSAPYNFFLTAITDSKPTHNEPLSITLQEILDESLGEIESSVQINFMVDIGWLLGHYYFAGCLETPLLVLYGETNLELSTISQKKPQVTAIRIQMSSPFATHHSKLMLFGYKDGSMRIVVSTANLYEDDWHNRTQGIWISPKLEQLPDNCDTSFGESPTGFRNDLILYLVEYKQPKLQQWISRIRKTDFRSVNVFFVASVPGGFRASETNGHLWGHARVGSVLSKHATKIDDNCSIVAQSSSIGSLGPNVQSWISSDIGNSFRRDSTPIGIRRLPQFKMIYPSFNNVKNSHDDLLGGGCLPYSQNTNDKQLWLRNHLHQWKAQKRYRSKAMPHIKTYCRWSDQNLYWFILTSANLSKAAWGAFNKNPKLEQTLRIYNYEAGVIFIPKFITGEDTFPLDKERDGIPPFPVPYDIPLTPYGPDDRPFVMDYLKDIL